MKIHISETTKKELEGYPYDVEERGSIEVKVNNDCQYLQSKVIFQSFFFSPSDTFLFCFFFNEKRLSSLEYKT